jgi:CelD/BcsL family acetyltransferase involved in cellulose biosynthesis
MTPRITFARSADEFAAIRTAWQDLWARSAGYIFQHHDWLSGWMNGIAIRREIRVLVALAWDNETLVGAIPMAVHRRRGLRMLNWAGQLFSDYCDGLLDPLNDPNAILPALWQAIMQDGGFDLISLQQVRPDARCRRLLDDLTREPKELRPMERQERCMRIDNRWESGAAFFRSLSKKGRNNHTRGKRILSEIGGEPVFRVIEADQDPSQVFDEIWRLKEIWLRATEPTSPLLGHDRFVLRSVLDAAWRTGLAKVFLLECGGQIAAGSINFVYANRMEAYLTAYDTRFERASPGTILIVEYAQWACDRGLTHVDFLRGDEAFKFRMANAETVLSGYTGARTLFGQVARSGHRFLSRRRQSVETAEMPSASPAVELEPV